MCTAYEGDGARTESFPVPALLDSATPVYEMLTGWRYDISDIRRFEDLPSEAQQYVECIEAMIGVPIRLISVGPHREALIHRECRNGSKTLSLSSATTDVKG